jgi:SAM-dependent methyltransferase
VTDYSYVLDAAEILRYRAMAARALEHEAELWAAAGITANAAVVDLGCGPGTFLPDLAARTAPDGRLVGVDASSAAVRSARSLIDQLGLGDRVQLVQASAQDTGLESGTFDVVFIRNLLVHNGSAAAAILDHSRRLLHPAGHLFSVEPDISGLRFLNGAAEEDELERRWVQMAQAHGNDPTLGAEDRLTALIAANGFRINTSQARVDRLTVERSPAWTARAAMVEAGFASDHDIDRWNSAITTRLRAIGPLDCRLPVTAVLAQPA